MKIVQINAVYEYSSTGRTTKEMHEDLSKRGIESYVFCCNLEDLSNNIYRMGNILDHKIHSVCSRIFGLQGYFSHIPTINLIRKLRVISPDVVILRNLHANYINIPMVLRYLGKNNISTIVVLHDCFFFTGHCCYYTKDRCNKWLKECNSCPILHKYNKSLFFDRTKKMFRDKKKLFASIKFLSVVGVSDWVTNEARRSPIFENAFSIQRIYNWINQSVFYPRDVVGRREKYGFKDSDFVVLGVAQYWGDVKGLPQFIDLARRMPNIKILLVGHLEQSDLPHNIIKVGTTNNIEELALLYSMADVFVNFSIQETFGKVAAESLSCGTPVIVNQSTANPELCGDGCGLIVKERDSIEVIDSVEHMIKKGKACYTTRCQSFARDNFSQEKGLQAYSDLFVRLTKANKNKSYGI